VEPPPHPTLLPARGEKGECAARVFSNFDLRTPHEKSAIERDGLSYFLPK